MEKIPLFLDFICLVTRLNGGKIQDPRAENDTRGSRGDYNLQFEDLPDRGWHLKVDVGTSHLRKGFSADARSTMRLDTRTFVQLVNRQKTLVTAQMMGDIQIQGDGHGIMFLAALVSQIQHAKEKRGIMGELSNRFLGFFLDVGTAN